MQTLASGFIATKKYNVLLFWEVASITTLFKTMPDVNIAESDLEFLSQSHWSIIIW